MKSRFFDRDAVSEMFDNDSLEERGGYSIVPDAFGVNDDDGSAAAYSEARSLAALNAARPEKKTLALQEICEERVELRPATPGGAEISGTHKDMSRIGIHPWLVCINHIWQRYTGGILFHLPRTSRRPIILDGLL